MRKLLGREMVKRAVLLVVFLVLLGGAFGGGFLRGRMTTPATPAANETATVSPLADRLADGRLDGAIAKGDLYNVAAGLLEDLETLQEGIDLLSDLRRNLFLRSVFERLARITGKFGDPEAATLHDFL